jgi:SAM-dependent methyltransferase
VEYDTLSYRQKLEWVQSRRGWQETEERDHMTQLYDEIGIGYRNYRRPDPRFATAILRALGAAQTVVNVGAGAGSYEPTDRAVIAVEPSRAMIHQRLPGSALVVQASATALPFREAAFEAALAILTVHHWPNPVQGLTEMARVTRQRIVIVTWDPAVANFWLIADYFPAIAEIDRQICPAIEVFRETFGAIEVHPLPVPHDCLDGFLGAYWRRPHAYLDAGVRSAISTFAKLAEVDTGLARLRGDLANGTWERRYGYLLQQSASDLGYRLVIAHQRPH